MDHVGSVEVLDGRAVADEELVLEPDAGCASWL